MGSGLRIARTTILTYLALLLAGLVGGAAIVEEVFSWPGIGQWAITAMTRLDIPDIEGFVVVITAIGLTIFFALEVIIAILDPRIGAGSVE